MRQSDAGSARIPLVLPVAGGSETPQGGVGWRAPGGLAAGATVVARVPDEDAAEGRQDRPAAGTAQGRGTGG
jgi:hypothetical protein